VPLTDVRGVVLVGEQAPKPGDLRRLGLNTPQETQENVTGNVEQTGVAFPWPSTTYAPSQESRRVNFSQAFHGVTNARLAAYNSGKALHGYAEARNPGGHDGNLVYMQEVVQEYVDLYNSLDVAPGEISPDQWTRLGSLGGKYDTILWNLIEIVEEMAESVRGESAELDRQKGEPQRLLNLAWDGDPDAFAEMVEQYLGAGQRRNFEGYIAYAYELSLIQHKADDTSREIAGIKQDLSASQQAYSGVEGELASLRAELVTHAGVSLRRVDNKLAEVGRVLQEIDSTLYYPDAPSRYAEWSQQQLLTERSRLISYQDTLQDLIGRIGSLERQRVDLSQRLDELQEKRSVLRDQRKTRQDELNGINPAEQIARLVKNLEAARAGEVVALNKNADKLERHVGRFKELLTAETAWRRVSRDVARDVISYVRSELSYGPANNEAIGTKYDGGAMRLVGHIRSIAYLDLTKRPLGIFQQDRMNNRFLQLAISAVLAKHFKTGNCHEHAAVALGYLWDDPKMVGIPITVVSHLDDHVYLVVGPLGHPNSLVIDPWPLRPSSVTVRNYWLRQNKVEETHTFTPTERRVGFFAYGRRMVAWSKVPSYPLEEVSNPTGDYRGMSQYWSTIHSYDEALGTANSDSEDDRGGVGGSGGPTFGVAVAGDLLVHD
ncbi:hypothetical protein, partial [Micromonospora polyrhachis]